MPSPSSHSSPRWRITALAGHLAGQSPLSAWHWSPLTFSIIWMLSLAVLAAGSLTGLMFLSEFRIGWLEERLAKANFVALALESAPSQDVVDELVWEDLRSTEILAISFDEEGATYRVLARPNLPSMDARIDLDQAGFWQHLGQMAQALMPRSEARIIQVQGMVAQAGERRIGIVVDESYLRADMVGFARRILGLILAATAGAVLILWLSLRRVILRPLRQLTANMRAFQERPEDKGRILKISNRRDEIGEAERRLAAMEEQIHDTLRQKQRAAALGEGVQKINHDLRNILASAQLLSDQITTSPDSSVRRLAPRLVASLDRAIGLCTRTLEYGRAEAHSAQPEKINMRQLVEQVAGELGTGMGAGVIWANEVPPNIDLWADATDMFRLLANLARNAGSAILSTGEVGRILVRGEQDGAFARIILEDSGPGLPPRAKEHLWTPFAGRGGGEGFGLGLPIARELAHLAGGKLELASTGAEGTRFEIFLPLYQGQDKKSRPDGRLVRFVPRGNSSA